jgi:tRNA threonylcarbamoyladenosine biosynthesis protein TsaE
MSEASFLLPDEIATARFGAALAPLLARGDVVALQGPLGAGKTALARAIIAALIGGASAPSPTYSLVETYKAGDVALFHFDLYRLEKVEDVWELGFEDALDGICLIEWPEKVERLLPASTLVVRLSMDGEGRRVLIRAGDEAIAALKRLNLA